MDVFFEWLIDRWESLYCAFIVRPYERAVHIRRGKLLRICPPGFHWKLPFEIDEIWKVNVVSTTTNLNTQVVTDTLGQSYVVSVVVKWKVKEEQVARLIIDLEDYEDVLNDTVYGMLARGCREQSFDNIAEVEARVATAVRYKLGKYGFDLEDLWVTDISKARTLRLVTGGD